MSRVTTIVLADDHGVMRQALAEWLDREPNLSVVASLENADQAVAEAIRLRPDIVLLDIDMPGLEAFEAARIIRVQLPNTRVVFLSAFFHDLYVEQALAAGASGYVTKAEPADSVAEAIRTVCSGEAYFSPEVADRLVMTDDGIRLDSERRTSVASLTRQQLRVLRHLAQGLSRREIAETMHLSAKTVDRHCDDVMARLGIHDRLELARFAIREGLIEA